MRKLLLCLIILVLLVTSCTTVKKTEDVSVIDAIETIDTTETIEDTATDDIVSEVVPDFVIEEDTVPLPVEEELSEVAVTSDLYVVGTVFEWYATEEGQLKADASGKIFSLTITITEEDYAEWALDLYGEPCAALKVINNVNEAWYGVEDQDFDATNWILTTDATDNLLLKAGQYIITYNMTEDEVTVSLL